MNKRQRIISPSKGILVYSTRQDYSARTPEAIKQEQKAKRLRNYIHGQKLKFGLVLPVRVIQYQA